MRQRAFRLGLAIIASWWLMFWDGAVAQWPAVGEVDVSDQGADIERELERIEATGWPDQLP